jgi:HAT1-interacting factor 1
MAGILAQVLGETTAEQKARIEDATKNATDLSGLVKKKKPKAGPTNGAASTANATSGKRKLDDTTAEGDLKRAKTEELADAR